MVSSTLMHRCGMLDRNKLFLLLIASLWWCSLSNLGFAVAVEPPTLFVPGRSIAERDALCTKFNRDKNDWEIGNADAYYSLQIRPRNDFDATGCLVDSDRAVLFNDATYKVPSRKIYLRDVCRQDDKLIKWTSSGGNVWARLPSTDKLKYLSVNGNYATTNISRTQTAIPSTSDFSNINKYYRPIWCPCGHEFLNNGTCVDIDECKEEFECPFYSLCRNIDKDYECHCDSGNGYANQDTLLSLVPKSDGVCVKIPIRIIVSNLDSSQFTVSLTGVTEPNATLQLYLIDEKGAASMDQQRKITFKFTHPQEVKNFTFQALNGGTRFKVMVKTPARETWSDFITTKCYSTIIGNDTTGIPDSLEVIQEDGYIMFKFIDNSVCEDAYSFARAVLDKRNFVLLREIFTSDYYFFSGNKMREKYSPGRQAADSLYISKLIVGKQYAYEIRASSTQVWRVSNWARVMHTVRWEASIDGRVTLQPKAGLLPVEKVTVDYILEDLNGTRIAVDCSLKSEDGWCRTETTSSGKFQIKFNLVDAALNNNDEFPVRLRFAKMTEDLPHRFLCNEGVMDCTLLANTTSLLNETKYNASVIHLRHLQFGAVVNVIDDTAVAFRGKVTVAGTEMPGAGVLGCPIVGATVCIEEHSTRNKISVQDPVCVKTDAEGAYALPAVFGTVISPKVNYYNHTFEPANPDQIEKLRNGIRIQSGVIYQGYNLKDVTKTQLIVEVAGGLCDRTLGNAEIQLTMQGCPWVGQTLAQNQFLQYHQVIAQIVDLRVKSIKGAAGGDRYNIRDSLSPSQDTSIDLKDVDSDNANSTEQSANETGSAANTSGNNNTEATALTDAQQQQSKDNNFKRVRFQFDGEDKITALVTGTIFDSPSICGKDAQTEGVSSYSYVVMPAYQGFNLIVFVEQDFGYDDIPRCSKYPEGSMISIQNQVGATDDIDDQAWLSRLENQPGFEERVKLLKLCSPSCSLKLEMDEGTGEHAKVSVQLQAGQPRPFGDFTKPLFIKVEKSGTQHKTDFVLVGDYEVSDKFSVALPTHEPLLVIRDPPGGGSYSYYENVMSTVAVEIGQHEVFVGFDIDGSIGNGVDGEVGVCNGLGVAACQKLVQGGVEWEVDLGGGADFETYNEVETSKSASFTTTWSYSTSADPWNAGKDSDVFLVPNLNVKFKEVKVVSWTNVTCASAITKLKFALDSPDNKPAIGFLSRFDIENVEIPELTRLGYQNELSMNTSNCMDEPSEGEDEQCEEFRSNRNAMYGAAHDWQNFLDAHDNTSRAAAAGSLDIPQEWFKTLRDSNTPDAHDYLLPAKHYTGLIPKDLSDGAVRLNNAINAKAAEDSEKKDDLENINLIKFDGGGAELNFQLDKEMVDDHTKKIGAPIENSLGRQNAGAGMNFDTAISSVEIKITLSAMQHTEVERHHTLTSSVGKQTSIGFVLSDPDNGDLFDVAVYLDPRYGTFVFHTTSGRSQCPHEEGTVYREIPKLMLRRQPNGMVLPDATLVFEVELVNAGISASSFVLFTDNRANTGLLTQLVNGATLAAPQTYDEIGAGESITTTIAIKRGPVDYDYAALPLKFASACEYAAGNLDGSSITLFNIIDSKLPNGTQDRIRFAEPCPSIFWASDMAVDRSFRVNKADLRTDAPLYRLPIVVRNPEASYRSYQDVMNSPLGRLEDAGVWYRRVGASRWSRAFMRVPGTTTSIPINFTLLSEDNYGYISAEWELGSLSDGEYELEARTICESSPTLPAFFNFAATERIQGTIDRREPKLLGLPTPNGADLLFPGDAIHFAFTEPILCTRPFVFEIVARVSTIPDVAFDNSVNDNLIVVCEGRTIAVAFDPALLDFALLNGATVVVKVKGTEDLNGNPTDSMRPISHVVTVATTNLQTSSISFQVNLNDADISDGNGRHLASSLEEEIQATVARAAHISVERVIVSPSNSSTRVNERTWYDVHIRASTSLLRDSSSSNTEEQNSLTAYHHLYRNLLAGTESEAFFPMHHHSHHPQIHIDPTERKRAYDRRRLAIMTKDHNDYDMMDPEMESMVLDDASGDTDAVLLLSRLGGIENAVRQDVDVTDMRLDEMENVIHQTDLRLNGIENAVRQNDVQLDDIARLVQQNDRTIRQNDLRLHGIESAIRQYSDLLSEFRRMRRTKAGTKRGATDRSDGIVWWPW